MHKVDLEKELGQLYWPNAKEVVAVAFIDARTTRRGKHHEIYLSDIRRPIPPNGKRSFASRWWVAQLRKLAAHEADAPPGVAGSGQSATRERGTIRGRPCSSVRHRLVLR
jgi:hypothetical protein